MKKIFILTIILLYFFELKAQDSPIAKGRKVVGLSGSYGISNFNDEIIATATDSLLSISESNLRTFGAGPFFGYFVGERWLIGISLGYSRNITERKDQDFNFTGTTSSRESISTSNSFRITPVARYYIPIINEKFYFYLEGNFNLAFGTNKQSFTDLTDSETSERTDDTQSIGASILGTFVFFPSNKWSLELDLGGFRYSRNSRESGGTTASQISKSTNDGFSFSLDNNPIQIGINFYF